MDKDKQEVADEIKSLINRFNGQLRVAKTMNLQVKIQLPGKPKNVPGLATADEEIQVEISEKKSY